MYALITQFFITQYLLLQEISIVIEQKFAQRTCQNQYSSNRWNFKLHSPKFKEIETTTLRLYSIIDNQSWMNCCFSYNFARCKCSRTTRRARIKRSWISINFNQSSPLDPWIEQSKDHRAKPPFLSPFSRDNDRGLTRDSYVRNVYIHVANSRVFFLRIPNDSGKWSIAPPLSKWNHLLNLILQRWEELGLWGMQFLWEKNLTY